MENQRQPLNPPLRKIPRGSVSLTKPTRFSLRIIKKRMQQKSSLHAKNNVPLLRFLQLNNIFPRHHLLCPLQWHIWLDIYNLGS